MGESSSLRNNNNNKKVTVSAPGKLLLAGGYLVLESPNRGVVLAVDKRFYCTAETAVVNSDSSSSSSTTTLLEIAVHSPQFGQSWHYTWDTARKQLARVNSNDSVNGFVEKTLNVCLLALWDDTRHGHYLSKLNLTIQGDNDFYSLIPHLQARGASKSLAAAQALPRFLPAPRLNGKILKTGLGSSACLVTSLVAALWYTLQDGHEPQGSNEQSDDDDTNNVDMVFKLAQICHCHAQGKVGSGFDVAAACHGSHIYQRFPKELLAKLLTQLDDSSETTVVSTDTLRQSIQNVLQSTWQGGLQAPLTLPTFVQVMLADVSGGSESPSMARTVLAWKKGLLDEDDNSKSTKKAVPHWDDLIRINQRIATLLQKLGSQQVDEAQMQTLMTVSQDQWASSSLGDVGQTLCDLRAAAQGSRHHLKAMGEAAGVPIEPDEQTALVDATMQIPGVICALVPGAGGYDAIACLYINHPTVQHAVADFWCTWSQASVCPLTVQCAPQGQGLRLETTTEDMSG